MNIIALITALYAAANSSEDLEAGGQLRVKIDDAHWGLINIVQVELTVDKEGNTIVVIHTERP